MGLLPALDRLKETALNLLFPARCLGCGQEGKLLCRPCCQAFPRIISPCCQRCGLPIGEGNLCPLCSKSSFAFDGIRSPFLLEGILREAIHDFKYRNLKALAAPLGELLAEYLQSNPLAVDALVPVPLYPARLRQRGYNQSSLLARELGRIADLPLIEGSLLRQRDTAPQTKTKGAEERHSNVKEAFTCCDQRLKGKHILIIDDVCTTGATMDACAAALKQAGAASIWGLTLAREL